MRCKLESLFGWNVLVLSSLVRRDGTLSYLKHRWTPSGWWEDHQYPDVVAKLPPSHSFGMWNTSIVISLTRCFSFYWFFWGGDKDGGISLLTAVFIYNFWSNWLKISYLFSHIVYVCVCYRFLLSHSPQRLQCDCLFAVLSLFCLFDSTSHLDLHENVTVKHTSFYFS